MLSLVHYNSKIHFRNKKLLQNVTDRLVLAGWRLPINAARAIYYVGPIYNLEIQLENLRNKSSQNISENSLSFSSIY